MVVGPSSSVYTPYSVTTGPLGAFYSHSVWHGINRSLANEGNIAFLRRLGQFFVI